MGKVEGRFSAEFSKRFEILGRLGEGGMSVVYRARQRDLDREVAIKVLTLPPGTPGSERERLKGEGKALAGLTHPHIVRLYDVAFDEDTPYLVLELVDGKTLRRLLDEGRQPLDRVLSIMHAVAGGLGYAHARGFVHRDIKPENILVDRDGHAKLTDFGLARAQGTGRLTEAGYLMGTPAYMAPEVIRGEDAGAPADVYACGVILFEALTGHVPFESDGAVESLTAKLRQPAPDVIQLRPTTARSLADLVRACLERKPARRPADGHALARAIEAALSLSMVGRLSRAALALRAAPTRFARRPRRAALAALAAVAVGASLGLALHRIWRDHLAPPSIPAIVTPLPQGLVVRCTTATPAPVTVWAEQGDSTAHIQETSQPAAGLEHRLVIAGLHSGERYRVAGRAGEGRLGPTPEVMTLVPPLLPPSMAATLVGTGEALVDAGIKLPDDAVVTLEDPRQRLSLRPARTRRALLLTGHGLALTGASATLLVETPDGFREKSTIEVPPLARRIRTALEAKPFLQWLDQIDAALDAAARSTHRHAGSAPRDRAAPDQLLAGGPALPATLDPKDPRHATLGQALSDVTVPLEARLETCEALMDVERIDRLCRFYKLDPPHGLPALHATLMRETTETASVETVPAGATVLLLREKKRNNLHVEGNDRATELLAIHQADPEKVLSDQMEVQNLEIPSIPGRKILGMDGRTTSGFVFVNIEIAPARGGQPITLRIFGDGEGVKNAENPLGLLGGADKESPSAGTLPFQRFWLHLAPGILPAGTYTMRLTAHPLTPAWVRRAPWAVPAIYAIYLLPEP